MRLEKNNGADACASTPGSLAAQPCPANGAFALTRGPRLDR